MSLLVNADYNPLKEGEGKMCPIVLNGHGGHQFYQSFQEKYMRRKFLSHQLIAAGLMERSTTSSEILKKVGSPLLISFKGGTSCLKLFVIHEWQVDRLRQIEVNICRSLFTFEFLEDHLQLTQDSLDLAFESLICSKLVGMVRVFRKRENSLRIMLSIDSTGVGMGFLLVNVLTNFKPHRLSPPLDSHYS